MYQEWHCTVLQIFFYYVVADRLTVIVEAVVDKGLPVFFGNLLQCHHLSKTIEWIFRVAEYVHHHVAFASIETVRRAVLSLPDRTHGSLQSLPVGQVCQLLELVNADNDMDAFCLGYFFRKIEYLLGAFLQRLET